MWGSGARPGTAPRPRPARARREMVTIRIPPGVPEETMLRLPGRGTPSPAADGEPGDAYVVIRAETDPRFTRAGADLRHDLHITVPPATSPGAR